jgi:hypothetical protein
MPPQQAVWGERFAARIQQLIREENWYAIKTDGSTA